MRLSKYQRLTILWALFIFIICNADLGGVGKSSFFFPGFDKLTHCGLFVYDFFERRFCGKRKVGARSAKMVNL